MLYKHLCMSVLILLCGCAEKIKTPLAEKSLQSDRDMLAEICPSYYLNGKGTQAEYITNTLASGTPKKAIYLPMPERFSSEYIGFDYSREGARKIIEQFKADAERGFKRKEKNCEITIPYVDEKPEIDGIILKEEWNAAYTFKGESILDSEEVPSGNTEWRIMYDKDFLYICALIPDKDIKINSEFLYKGDSLEVFIMPDREMRTYWELILAPDSSPFSAWHMVNGHGGFTSVRGVKPLNLKTAVKKYSDSFVVELALPFYAMPSLKKRLPYSGAELDFMMVRTNLDGQNYSRSAPVPFLYDGHNFAGYIHGKLQ